MAAEETWYIQLYSGKFLGNNIGDEKWKKRIARKNNREIKAYSAGPLV